MQSASSLWYGTQFCLLAKMKLLLNLNAFFLLILAGIISSDAYCPAPYEDIGGHCLLIETVNSGTWQEMKLYCEEAKGRLLKLDSADLLYEIVLFIKSKDIPAYNYWTDANDIDEEGKFMHLDGTPVKMGTPFWGTHGSPAYQEPDDSDGTQDCVHLYGAEFSFMYDYHCESKNMRAICELEVE